MLVTSLKFKDIIERFHQQDKYKFMLLFVSSFDGKDKIILKEILDNANRIDRITGNQICFFYFIKNRYDDMNEKLTRWIMKYPDWKPLYGEGVLITMQTSDDICSHFRILRSNLPAFILIDKNETIKHKIYPINDFNDLENFLTPLNILHNFIEDKNTILSDYKYEREKGIVTQKDVDLRDQVRRSWNATLKLLEKKQKREYAFGLINMAEKRKETISKYKKKLDDNPPLEIKGFDENIKYPYEQLENIRQQSCKRLNIALNIHDSGKIIDKLNTSDGYSLAIVNIWDQLLSKDLRLSKIIEKIKFDIADKSFDVFISCKSQDYESAREIYDFLILNGHRPFLADISIKEIGIDQYTFLIGEVISFCSTMIVVATDVKYLDTPYVSAEWHLFVNDINTGHKPNARLINILSPNINEHHLPSWLRDKQCLTLDNYKQSLMNFII